MPFIEDIEQLGQYANRISGEYFTTVWRKLRDRYPSVEEAKGIAGEFGLKTNEIKHGSTMSYWRNLLIHAQQQNRFHEFADFALNVKESDPVTDLQMLAELHMRVYDFVCSLPEPCYVLDGEVSLILPDHTAVQYLDAKMSVRIICSKLSTNERDLLWSDDSLRGAIMKASAGFDALVAKYRLLSSSKKGATA